MGDIVVTTPIVRSLKTQKKAEIHFLVKEKFKDVLLGNPYIDKLITFKKDWTEVKQLLKHEDYDLVIDLHKNLRSQRVRFFLRKPYMTFPKMNMQKLLLTAFHWDLMPDKHLVDRYFDGIEDIGVQNDGKGLDFFISEQAKTSVSSLFINKIPKKYIVIVLGAAHVTKRIPATLVIEMIDKYDTPAVLIGGKDVRNVAEIIVNSTDKKLINLVGKLTIHESAEIMNRSSVVITGDTGMMHIAAALKKEIVMIWGGTHRKIGMYPYYPSEQNQSIDISKNLNCQPCSKIGKSKCPKKHMNCLGLISAEEVILATNALIK